LPFQLKGEPNYAFTENDRKYFKEAAKNISQYSQNMNNITFLFNSTIKIKYTAVELNEIKRNVSKTFQNDFKNSTYGFVHNVIMESDENINYTGVDAVILVGSSSIVSQVIAEAFMFTRDRLAFGYGVKSTGSNRSWWDSTIVGDNWFDPIQTAEGDISNVVLLYNDLNNWVLTHEIMHLYGLTDLYGSESSPLFSLMSEWLTFSLLPYELFILGWIPDTKVTCLDREAITSQNLANNRFVLDYSKGNQSLIIPTSITTALVIDVLSNSSSSTLLYYSLDIDRRPPIEIFRSKRELSKQVNLSNYGGISSQLVSPEYTMLISDNDGSKITLLIIPSKQIDSEEVSNIIKGAEQKKNALETAAKAAETKRITITCIKGKLIKKVTRLNPKCPAGYKKK
jgi:hypothetical protein